MATLIPHLTTDTDVSSSPKPLMLQSQSTLSVKLYDGPTPTSPCMFMLAGWPDTHELWDSVVDRFKTTHRCIVTCMPDFDQNKLSKKKGYTLNEILDRMEATVDKYTQPDEQVILVVHDWGSLFGFLYNEKRPEKVAKIITIDIGANSNLTKQDPQRKLAWSAWYQVNFAFIFWLGLTFGSHTANAYMALFFAGWDIWGPLSWGAKWARPMKEVKWWMMYPYFHLFSFLGQVKKSGNVFLQPPTCPILFIYGTKKRAVFHSKEWLQYLADRPDCTTVAMNTSHWVMYEKPEEVNNEIAKWLKV